MRDPNGPGMDERYARQDTTIRATVDWYLTDNLGSVRQMCAPTARSETPSTTTPSDRHTTPPPTRRPVQIHRVRMGRRDRPILL